MDILFYTGQTTKVVLPSTREVEIRETNAGDDELISNISDIRESTNIIKFLASIITMDFTLGRKPTTADVLNYHYNDQWYLVLRQRILNRGKELVFNYKCQSSTCKDKPVQSFTEDLAELDGDLSNPNYTPIGSQIMRYPMGIATEHEFKVSSGAEFKFEIMTGVHGKKRLDIPDTEQTRNTMMSLRNLKIKQGGNWTTVTTFTFLPSKVASEIRAEITKIDPEFHPIISGECPHCKTPFAQSLWGMPDFFWPGEEM